MVRKPNSGLYKKDAIMKRRNSKPMVVVSGNKSVMVATKMVRIPKTSKIPIDCFDNIDKLVFIGHKV